MRTRRSSGPCGPKWTARSFVRSCLSRRAEPESSSTAAETGGASVQTRAGQGLGTGVWPHLLCMPSELRPTLWRRLIAFAHMALRYRRPPLLKCMYCAVPAHWEGFNAGELLLRGDERWPECWSPFIKHHIKNNRQQPTKIKNKIKRKSFTIQRVIGSNKIT